MENLVSKIKSFNGEVTYQNLNQFIVNNNAEKVVYSHLIPEPETKGDYGRNILTLDPFECVLIHWPPGIESAVHHHKGLFGYVIVLEGELDNVLYREINGKLEEYSIERYVKGGTMPEPDGIIHKIANHSKDKRAVTLHFYYPALTTLENLRLFNLETGAAGILSKDAPTASWLETPGHFKEIQKNAFDYVSFEQVNKNKSHSICNVIPKPDKNAIGNMNARYFCEQAEQYDFSDFNQPNRKNYIDSIDHLIGTDLKNHSLIKVLDIAAGTGRRALNIREISNQEYEIVGVDISKEMAKIAESRGLRMYHQDWENDDPHTGEYFDAATFLYAFGHISHEKGRIKTLNKIHSYLKPGAPLYVDLFSALNETEWGPLAMKHFKEKNMQQQGYQSGDVFYKKNNCKEIAFLHYFTESEFNGLLSQTGFTMESIQFVSYSKNAGKLVDSSTEGNLFIKAIRNN